MVAADIRPDRAASLEALTKLARPILQRMAGYLTPTSKLSTLLRPAVNRALGGREITIVVAAGPARGTRLVIRSGEEKFYWTGNHEPHLLRAIAGLLTPGDCFWDVGAHIGYVSCFAARHLTPAGAVVAFEPVSETQERLRLNARANGLANVVIAPYAVASASGPAALYERHRSAMWSLEEDLGRGSIAVERITLDAAAELYPTPAAIKIDAEGAELEVIRGGAALIARHRPSLLVEFSDDELVNAARDELRDYSFELLADNHWLLRASPRS